MISYRKADVADLKNIVDVHTQCFPTSFLTSLGKKVLYNLYKTYLDNKMPFIVGADDNNNIIGFCAGGLEGKNVTLYLKRKISCCWLQKF